MEHRPEAAPPLHARSVSHVPRGTRHGARLPRHQPPRDASRPDHGRSATRTPSAQAQQARVHAGPFAEPLALGTTTSQYWTPRKTARRARPLPLRPTARGRLPHGCALLPETTPRPRARAATPDPRDRRPAPGDSRPPAPRHRRWTPGHGPPNDDSDARGHVRFAARRHLASPGSTATQPSGGAPSRPSHDHRPAAPRRRSTAELPQPSEPGTVPPRMASVRGARAPQTASLPWRTHRSRGARRAGTQCARTVPTTATPRRTRRPLGRSLSRPLGTSVDPRTPVPRETESWPEAVIIRAPHPCAPEGDRRPPPRPPRDPAPQPSGPPHREMPHRPRALGGVRLAASPLPP